jgi:hypothetical protein
MKKIIILLLLIPFFVNSQNAPKKSNKKAALKTQSTKNKTKTTPKKLSIGSHYKGGVVYELYADGSGGKVFFYVSSDNYNTMQMEVENEYRNGIKCYVADDYELQTLFQMDLIGPNAGDDGWTYLWFMGDRRMSSYSKPYACKAETILNLPQDSNERISKIINYGWEKDRYSGNCKYAVIGIFNLK